MNNIKVKEDKERNLIYRTYCCHICNAELIRTIENKAGHYMSPAFIIHCKKCAAKHSIKQADKEIEFDLISFNKPIKSVY